MTTADARGLAAGRRCFISYWSVVRGYGTTRAVYMWDGLSDELKAQWVTVARATVSEYTNYGRNR